MSSLFKLSIQGIRSFDCERSETIQFGFPLTLICGQNGCGKTTIIECLKYATTGDLPPNSKGGAFVIDTDIVGRNNVTAQVKLAFKDVVGRSMITTRSMQLTKKRKGSTITNNFKTLEGQHSIIENGNKKTLSTKNSELDTRIPLHLGASKAVLDYVIFCHQDDSLWPLSEASVLKKRFDDIFEASKFTKVLDNLKNIKKDMTIDIKLIEQSVNHLKLDKERAKKINAKLAEINEKSESLSLEIVEIKFQIDVKEKEAELLFQSNQQYQQTLAHFDQLSHSKELLIQQIDRLSGSIDILTEPYDELIKRKTHFEEFILNKQAELGELKENLKSIQGDISENTLKFNDLNRLDGSLQLKRRDFDENMNSFCRKLTLHLKQVKFHSKLVDELDINARIEYYEQFVEHLQMKHNRILDEAADLSSRSSALEDKSEERLNEISSKITKEIQDKSHFLEIVRQNEVKISSSKAKLKNLQSDETILEDKLLEMNKINVNYEEAKTSNKLENIESEINTKKGKLNALELEAVELNNKINSNSKQSDSRARLKYLTEIHESKSKHLARISNQFKNEFDETSIENIEIDTYSNTIATRADEINSKVIEAKANLEIQMNQSRKLEAQHLAAKDNCERLSSSLAAMNMKILRVVPIHEIGSFDRLLKEAEENHNITFDNLNTVEVSKQFKIRAIQAAESMNHCNLCQRPFDLQELKSFLTLLRESLEENVQVKFEQDFEEAKKELEQIRSIESDVKLKISSEREFEAAKERSSNLEEELETSSILIAELELKHKTFQERHLKILELKDKAMEIRKFKVEIEEVDVQITNLNRELNQFGATQTSSANLHTQLQEMMLEIKLLRQQINNLVESRHDHHREISMFENRIKDCKLSISNLRMSLVDVKNTEANLKEYQHDVEMKQVEIERIQKDVIHLTQEKKLSVESHKNMRQENKEAEAKLNLEKNLIESILRSSGDLLEKLKNYISIDEPLLLKNIQELERLKSIESELKKDAQEKEQCIVKLDSEINRSSVTKHNIISNIDFRDLQKDLENTEGQIQELDIESASEMRDQYNAASNSLRESLVNLNSEYSGKSGEVKQLKVQVQSIKKELESEYLDIDKSYHQEWIKLQANILIANDIQTYSKALDNAIMKFHTSKMDDINRLLKELWSQTYKGTDIDSIAIKSDLNIQAKGNRSYNYRVVMYKSNAELDMRGRCSAGQKVLSSLLIRLALAECFGINCGMIALDEPTTNLDQENSESLAHSLNQIVSVRKGQRNFQLIVITHDERFLSHINGDQFADHFYRVQRDENQKSTIYSLPISKIREE